MKCIVVPAVEERADSRFAIADFKLDSLEAIDESWLKNLRLLKS
ncbi:hypothetical protein [Phormidium nigroviride]